MDANKLIIVIFVFFIFTINVYAKTQVSFEPTNQYNSGGVLNLVINPDKTGVFKYVYIFNEKDILQDTIIINNCENFICYNPVKINYNIPLDWNGNHYVMVYDYGINDYIKADFNVQSKIVFDRNLNCAKCGNHKVPPLTNVEMTISANGFNGNVNLVDYFEKDWTIVDANSGIVSDYDSKFNKISWKVNVNGSVSKRYIIKSPERTMPSTKYLFFTELSSRSNDWFVIVADPTNIAEELLPVVNTNTRLANIQLTQNQVDLIRSDDNLYLNIKKTAKLESELSDTILPASVINNAYCDLYYYTTANINNNGKFQVYNRKKGSLIDSANIIRSTNENIISLINLQNKGLTVNDINTLFIIVTNGGKSNSDFVYIDKIRCVIDYGVSSNLGIGISNELSNGVKWDIQTLPVTDFYASGNNGNLDTLYYIDINAEGTNVDVYLKGNGDLISGTNAIFLVNEKVSSSVTDNKVLTGIKNPITLNYVDNKLGNNLVNGTRIYLKFYLTVAGSQAPGNYVNLLNFKAVPTGVVP